MFVKFIIILVLLIVAIQCVTCKPNSARDCYLPEDKGRCRALIPRWSYDPDSKQCKQFNYGGCEGNRNNFLTKDACMDMCKGA